MTSFGTYCCSGRAFARCSLFSQQADPPEVKCTFPWCLGISDFSDVLTYVYAHHIAGYTYFSAARIIACRWYGLQYPLSGKNLRAFVRP